MADRGPHVPAPKVGKAKTAHQTKTREPPQKNPPKQNPKKTAPSLKPKVVVGSACRSVRNTRPSLSTRPTT